MMKFRSAIVRILCYCFGFFLCNPVPKVEAQSCPACGWTSNSYEYEADDGGCEAYYEEIDYYYCGQYRYSTTEFLGYGDGCVG